MKDKKRIRQALEYVRRQQGWNCELISANITQVGPDEVMVMFYCQISSNPDVKPCNRWEMFINGVHKSGGVIR